ncbi:MAG: PKD domain-containing protein [Dehalococcoidia bacterium]
MNKIFPFLISSTAAFILLAAACSAAPQRVATPPPVSTPASQPAAGPPIIEGIAGRSEWTTTSKGPLSCVATDPQGTKLTYSWSVDNGTLKGDGPQVTWTTPAAAGQYTVTVIVTNEAGAQATQSRTFQVDPLFNLPQDNTVYLKFTFPSPGPVTVSKRVPYDTVSEIQCTFSNADPNQLTIVWSAPVGKLSGDGIADGKASRVGWLPPGVPGQYTVNVQISDKAGHTATGSVNFDVYQMDLNGNPVESH